MQMTSYDFGWNFLNSAESAAELENEMAEHLSESSYQAISGLQANLAALLNAYAKNVHAKNKHGSQPYTS